MHLFDVLTQASVFANLTLLVVLLPLPAGVLYAVRPSESRLALMRPLSLASMFAALAGALAGIANLLDAAAMTTGPLLRRPVLLGLAETLVPLLLASSVLAVAWLGVAVGFRRAS